MANKKKRVQRTGEARQQGRPQGGAQPRPQPRQAARQQRQAAPSSISRTMLLGIVGGVAVIVVAVLVLVNMAGRPSAPPASSSGTPTSAAATSAADILTKGSADAKVTVEEYSDFQCPYCAQFALNTFPNIDKNYIQTGKVRWIYHNMQRIGDESKQAALAAMCAGDQGQFWAFHDKLFASQQGENQGAFSSDKLKSFAQGLGLDMTAFNSCFSSGKYNDVINQQLVQANQKGVTGTPTFFINGGQKLEGALPYSDFQKALDSALAGQ